MVYKIENMTNEACNKRAHNKQDEKQEERGSCQTLVAKN